MTLTYDKKIQYSTQAVIDFIINTLDQSYNTLISDLHPFIDLAIDSQIIQIQILGKAINFFDEEVIEDLRCDVPFIDEVIASLC
jgi:hypothetical protein